MKDADFEIPKANIKIDKDSFSILFNLFRKQDWLEKKTSETLELWNDCDDPKQQKLITDLLFRFRMLTANEISVFCDNIAKVICNEWNLTQEETLLVAICNDSKPDGSQYFLQVLKASFAEYLWKEERFVNNIKKIQELPYTKIEGKTIIVFDDFIGTGNTAVRKISWLKAKLAEKGRDFSIKMITLACMKEAEDRIKKLDIDYYTPLILEKGISDAYPEEEAKDKIAIMKTLESKLSEEIETVKLPSLGYGGSESIFSIEGLNTPNNVFPIFWWPKDKDGNTRKTILRRLL